MKRLTRRRDGLCPRCCLIQRLRNHSYCKHCRNEYMREARQAYRDLSPAARRKLAQRDPAKRAFVDSIAALARDWLGKRETK